MYEYRGKTFRYKGSGRKGAFQHKVDQKGMRRAMEFGKDKSKTGSMKDIFR